LVEELGYKEYGIDPVKMNMVSLAPKFLTDLLKWKYAQRNIFLALLSLTNSGEYGILITGDDLSNISGISIPSFYAGIQDLILEGWVIRTHQRTVGNPNIYFINIDKMMKYAGEQESNGTE
jgi:hypothetical protein